MCAQVAPSIECLRGYGRVRLKRSLFVLAAYARAKPCCWLYLARLQGASTGLSGAVLPVLRVSCCDAYRSDLHVYE